MDGVKAVLRDTLDLGSRADSFVAGTLLFESLPEFDSMAVVAVVLELEERFGVSIDGEDISAETFESVGSLSRFIEGKLAE